MIIRSIVIPVLMTIPLCWVFGRFCTLEELTRRQRRLAVAWGAIGAVGMSILMQVWLRRKTSQLPDDTQEFFLGAMMAPVTEEFAKALPLLVLWLLYGMKGRRRFLTLGLLMGAGFFLFEAPLQLLGAKSKQNWAEIFAETILAYQFSHSFYTGLTALGIGIASVSQSWLVKLFLPVIGYSGAVFFHATSNTMALAGQAGHGRAALPIKFQFAFLLFFFYMALLVYARMRISRLRVKVLPPHHPH